MMATGAAVLQAASKMASETSYKQKIRCKHLTKAELHHGAYGIPIGCLNLATAKLHQMRSERRDIAGKLELFVLVKVQVNRSNTFFSSLLPALREGGNYFDNRLTDRNS